MSNFGNEGHREMRKKETLVTNCSQNPKQVFLLAKERPGFCSTVWDSCGFMF